MAARAVRFGIFGLLAVGIVAATSKRPVTHWTDFDVVVSTIPGTSYEFLTCSIEYIPRTKLVGERLPGDSVSWSSTGSLHVSSESGAKFVATADENLLADDLGFSPHRLVARARDEVRAAVHRGEISLPGWWPEEDSALVR